MLSILHFVDSLWAVIIAMDYFQVICLL